MSLTLNEKQVIRSISDLIIHNPEYAEQLLEIGSESLPDNVQEIIQFAANNYATNERIKYLSMLHSKINTIRDRETKDIFKSSLSMHEHL